MHSDEVYDKLLELPPQEVENLGDFVFDRKAAAEQEPEGLEGEEGVDWAALRYDWAGAIAQADPRGEGGLMRAFVEVVLMRLNKRRGAGPGGMRLDVYAQLGQHGLGGCLWPQVLRMLKGDLSSGMAAATGSASLFALRKCDASGSGKFLLMNESSPSCADLAPGGGVIRSGG